MKNNKTIATAREKIILNYIRESINKTNENLEELNYFIKWAEDNKDYDYINKYNQERKSLLNELKIYEKLLTMYHFTGIINLIGSNDFMLVEDLGN